MDSHYYALIDIIIEEFLGDNHDTIVHLRDNKLWEINTETILYDTRMEIKVRDPKLGIEFKRNSQSFLIGREDVSAIKSLLGYVAHYYQRKVWQTYIERYNEWTP